MYSKHVMIKSWKMHKGMDTPRLYAQEENETKAFGKNSKNKVKKGDKDQVVKDQKQYYNKDNNEV